MPSISFRALTVLLLLASAPTPAVAQATDADVARLVTAMLGDTPMLTDLEQLVDGFGGRATGSAANTRAVEWALARFREARVDARTESFTMPGLWLERPPRMWGDWRAERGRKRP